MGSWTAKLTLELVKAGLILGIFLCLQDQIVSLRVELAGDSGNVAHALGRNQDELTEARRRVLLDAYQRHPERFVRRPPEPPKVPAVAWINPPAECRFHDTNEGH